MIIIGFDTEYVTAELEEESIRNCLLCYSYAVIDTTKKKKISGVINIDGGEDLRKRLSMNGFLAEFSIMLSRKGVSIAFLIQ